VLAQLRQRLIELFSDCGKNVGQTTIGKVIQMHCEVGPLSKCELGTSAKVKPEL
jgi:hypothetical protein